MPFIIKERIFNVSHLLPNIVFGGLSGDSIPSGTAGFF
jgi:hypothetical protein